MLEWSKAFFNLQNKDVQHITYATITVNVVVLLYSIVLFSYALQIRASIGVFINMVTEKDGNNLSNFLVVVGLLCLPSNLLSVYLLYVALTSDISRNSQVSALMYSLPFIILGTICSMSIVCIMIISHVYSKHEALHDGIMEAMNNYSSNSEFKMSIDKLQLQFDCCGSKHYNEWYTIPWYDSNLIKNKEKNYQQSTPFSCCSKRSTFVCIHHGIESNSLPYRYSRDLNFSISPFGCTTAIQQKKKSIGWGVIGRILFVILLQFAAATGIRRIRQTHFKDDAISTKSKSWLPSFQKGKRKTNKDEKQSLVEGNSTDTESYQT
ncbi:photoreceptor outer segment membrane glycoprotein 2-like isoform X1 [Photinus pyralis]|uniref:photoreceptor outer segment membrane glycoprotein 2-like isoform X1 n=1 Tax=Photinus pyralis TaxID=7054 RepID=UPI0012670E27|nr:photoreceptor outer segment membrane glycoprotein 2-like isoform X1 [Photinus pyralis]